MGEGRKKKKTDEFYDYKIHEGYFPELTHEEAAKIKDKKWPGINYNNGHAHVEYLMPGHFLSFIFAASS